MGVKAVVPGAPVAPPKLSKTDDKRLQDYRTASDQTEEASNVANSFLAKNRKTATGGWMGIPFAEPIAKMLPFTDPNLQDMDSDSIELALSKRKPGMRLTQMEFGKFLGAVPSTHSTGPQNEKSVHTVNNIHTVAAAKAAFYDKWASINGNFAGADQAWNGFKSQHFDADGNFNRGAPPAPRAGANAALKAKSGGNDGFALLGYEDH